MGEDKKAREGTNEELVKVLRRLADDLEAGKTVFVVMSAENFWPGEDRKIESSSDVSVGGAVPDELDPRLVLIGCIGNLIRTVTESVDLKAVDAKKALELLGLGDIKLALGGSPMAGKSKGKIIRGGFGHG